MCKSSVFLTPSPALCGFAGPSQVLNHNRWSTTGLSQRRIISKFFSSPLAGLVVQPLVGHLSDRVRLDSPLGRRRPFIAGGAAVIAIAVLIVGFSADLGRILGDSKVPGAARPRSVVVYVIGFWLLDVGNNATQGPCRALLADLTGEFNFVIETLNFYFIRLY
jgi:PUCC protein